MMGRRTRKQRATRDAGERCEVCLREYDPRWIRILGSVVTRSVQAGVNAFLHDHPVSMPYAYQASLTKRIAGALITNILEIERGIYSLRDCCDNACDTLPPGASDERQ